MFLKQEQVKPTHLTNISSYYLLSSSMDQNKSCENSGYLGKALLHITCKLSCHYLFRTSQQQSVYCAPSLQFAQYCTVYWRLIFIFYSYLCLGFQALLSIK